MNVRRRRYRDKKTGEQRMCARWMVYFRDARHRRVWVPGFTDRKQSEVLGRRFERLVAAKVAGERLDPDMQVWLEGLPTDIGKRLVAIGLVERAKPPQTLDDHIVAYEQALSAKGTGPKTVRQTIMEIRRVVDLCGVRSYAEIANEAVQRVLAVLREGTDKAGISRRTSNSMLGSLKRFCCWMVRSGRAATDPLVFAEGLNVEVDRRRVRRAMTVQEISDLLTTTEKGPDRFGLTGRERAALYHLALTTGLRANELRTLTVSSFDLDAQVPTVTVAAAFSKHKKQDTLPLKAEAVARLRDHLACRMPSAPAFKVPERTAEMLREDLAAAAISEADARGRVVDFHSLRTTFITSLARGGVSLQMAQKLARHSTPELTANVYSVFALEEQAQALASIPNLVRAAG